MSDFAFTPTWWFGMLLFGGMTIVSVLEWRGIIRTPFERVWPATAMGTGIGCAIATAMSVFGAIAEVAGLRITGLPFYTPAIIAFALVAVIAAALFLAFMRTPPRWAVPPHLRVADTQSEGEP